MAAKGEDVIKRYHSLKDLASNFRTRWDVMAPYLSLSRCGITTKLSPGQKLNPYVWDSTSNMALELMAQFIWGHIANPAQKWGFMQMRNPAKRESDAINEWLEECRDRMLAAFAASKFYAEGTETCVDWAGFGTGDMTIEEAPQAPQKTIHGFRGFHVKAHKTGRFYIAEGPDGRVDTHFTDHELTADQIKKRWPMANLPDRIKKAIAEGRPDDTFTIVHGVYPRPETDSRYAAGAQKMPFASCWVELESKSILVESGFPSFNGAVPRYMQTPGEVFGRGRGDIAFGDIWSLNEAKKMGFEDWALKIRPPVMMRHDAVIGSLKIVPAGPTSINTHGASISDVIMPWQTGSHPEVSQIKEEELRKSIRQVFYIDQILMLMETSKSEMTAFEFAKKMELLFKLLGPVYGRAQYEFLQPVWDIAFEQMLLAGAFSPPPDEIQETDGDIEVVFDNPLSRAQRATDVEAMSLAFQDMLPMAQVWPQILDRWDPDETSRIIMTVRGVPAKATRSDEEMAVFRQARQQQEQSEQQLAQMGQIAEAGGKVAPLLTALQGGKPS